MRTREGATNIAICAVFEGDRDGGEVFSSVADDGHDDDADEELRPSPCFDKGLDRADQDLAHEGDGDGRDEEDEKALTRAPVCMVLLRDLLHIEMLVRVEREIDACDIREDHADRNHDA